MQKTIERESMPLPSQTETDENEAEQEAEEDDDHVRTCSMTACGRHCWFIRMKANRPKMWPQLIRTSELLVTIIIEIYARIETANCANSPATSTEERKEERKKDWTKKGNESDKQTDRRQVKEEKEKQSNDETRRKLDKVFIRLSDFGQ